MAAGPPTALDSVSLTQRIWAVNVPSCWDFSIDSVSWSRPPATWGTWICSGSRPMGAVGEDPSRDAQCDAGGESLLAHRRRWQPQDSRSLDKRGRFLFEVRVGIGVIPRAVAKATVPTVPTAAAGNTARSASSVVDVSDEQPRTRRR